ncbi:MAG: MFS transporter [Rhodospirillales bacterium]|nr:MFS transporter [Rhodospirillales bacterium]MBO6785685.1 MFS transporter [Rhodospirillales bacterium]
MSTAKRNFLFLNIGHLLDHFFMLIFTTAVLTMESEFADSYGRLLLLTTWSFFFFGGASLPAGWLGDKWSRTGMMFVFFIGIGGASILTGFASDPLQIEIGLALVGIFGAIYHPIGLALVVEDAKRVGRALAINGVWGNMGVALAALTTGAIAEFYGWRMAFILPGVFSVGIGVLYGLHLLNGVEADSGGKQKKAPPKVPVSIQRRVFLFLIIAPLVGGLIFQATTISLPKIMDERLSAMLPETSEIGLVTALVFGCAAFAQLVVGELLDRYQTKRIYIFLVAVQLVACSLAITAAGWSSLAITLPLMLVTFGIIPVNDWIVAHFISTEYRSRVYAVKSVLVLGVGAVAVQMTGRLHEATGNFNSLFMVMAAAAAIVLVTTFILIPSQRPETVPAE